MGRQHLDTVPSNQRWKDDGMMTGFGEGRYDEMVKEW